MELCSVDYCLLSRSRNVSSLPDLNAWEEYMDLSKLAAFEKINVTSFLRNYEFGEVLKKTKGGEAREFRKFRNQCPEFVDRLVASILSCQLVSANLLQGLYSFCPELLLEGDNDCVLGLFNKLVRVPERSGALSGSESKAAVEEFVTYVVDVRARHISSGRSAEEINNVVEFLMADYSFLSRKNLCRVLKLCCLLALKPRTDFPRVTIDISNCAVPGLVVTSCVRGVQSGVAASNYKHSAFFTKHTMECVRDAIAASEVFMGCASVDPWVNICCADQSAIERRYMELFTAHLAQNKESS